MEILEIPSGFLESSAFRTRLYIVFDILCIAKITEHIRKETRLTSKSRSARGAPPLKQAAPPRANAAVHGDITASAASNARSAAVLSSRLMGCPGSCN